MSEFPEVRTKRYDNPKAQRLRRTAWILDDADDSYATYVREKVWFDDRHPHNIVTSLAAEQPEDADPLASWIKEIHYPVIDIDGPARVVPSATPGHFHLYLDKPVPREDYFEFLRAAEKIGLIEPGYLYASEVRGHTTAFIPEF